MSNAALSFDPNVRIAKLFNHSGDASIVHSPTALYLARGLTEVPRAPEGTERIRRVRMPWDEAVAAVLEGRITHGPSCVIILKVRLMLAHGDGLTRRRGDAQSHE